jgi:hypothetical protein
VSAPRGAAALVDAYLQACEDRDLNAAGQYLAPGAVLQFPGGVEYQSLSDLVDAPKLYAWVRKHRDRYAVATEADRTTVTSTGRLYGEWLDGTRFEGIRYVDVFVVQDELITSQLVWNDLREPGSRPASQTTAGVEPTPVAPTSVLP